MLQLLPTYHENYINIESRSCEQASSTRTSQRSVTRYSGQRSGSENPKWRDQVRRGINATTGYSRVGYIVDKALPIKYRSSVPCTQGYLANKGSAFTNLDELWHPQESDMYGAPSLSLSSSSNSAIMSFISDAKAQYNSMSGPTFLGELRQSLNMIRNPAKALRARAKIYLDHLRGRRGSFRTRKEAEDWLAKTWLEHSFGWMPLISDTKSGAEALARLIHGDIRFASVKGFGTESKASKPLNSSHVILGQVLGTRTQFLTTRNSVIIKGGVSAKATGPTLENAMHLFGFTPEEFVPTVWNLLPYSFLVDYFLNIGDILEATFFDRSGVTWISRTEIQEVEFQSSIAWHPPKTFKGTVSGGSYKVRKKSMNRTNVTPFVPTLEVSLPGSPQKWINMAALAATHKSLLPFHTR